MPSGKPPTTTYVGVGMPEASGTVIGAIVVPRVHTTGDPASLINNGALTNPMSGDRSPSKSPENVAPTSGEFAKFRNVSVAETVPSADCEKKINEICDLGPISRGKRIRLTNIQSN